MSREAQHGKERLNKRLAGHLTSLRRRAQQAGAFDFDSVAIRDDVYEQVILAAEEARVRPAPEVIVTGYADVPGSKEANLAMSRQRADVVANAILAELRDDERVTLIRGGRGARDLVVNTPRAEEANRRVVIIVR